VYSQAFEWIKIPVLGRQGIRMWLYTNNLGFYSVVHKPPCKKDELLVRARCKDDIEKLKGLLSDKFNFSGKVINSPKADYAYRMIVPRDIWAAFMARTAMELDYDNFKDTIPNKDHLRHEAYFRCWEAMYEWQLNLKKIEALQMKLLSYQVVII
jgi:hypothetical protein